MPKTAATMLAVALLLSTVTVRAQAEVDDALPSRGTKVSLPRSSARQAFDPPPRLDTRGAGVEFGGWGAGAWAGPPGQFGGHEISEQRGSVRQTRYQEKELLNQGIEPDIGNIPVQGAEDEGPLTERARKYLEHSLMYDDAAQGAARERTVTTFHPGHPTNNNNEFGDYTFGPPINGPLLEEAGPNGYGPGHDRCYGSGRCGRDTLCCPRQDGCGRGGCGGCGAGLGSCGGCGDEGCGSCGGNRAGWWENLTVSGGVQGFKSPIDLGRNGNFGIREGINWGLPLLVDRGIGGQLGLNALQSDLSGDNVAGQSSSARSQVFVTAGLFRRVLPGESWQGGVAYDYLHDDYYVTNDLHKLRGELSFVARNRDELGAWVSVDVGGSSLFESVFGERNTGWTSNDLYAAFWRRTLSNGTTGRAWAGASGSGDGMLGGELRIPFSDHLALEANVNYLIPKHGTDALGAGTQEAWNVAIGITWYPGGNAYCASFNPWRPLFGVADNSIFPYQRK